MDSNRKSDVRVCLFTDWCRGIFSLAAITVDCQQAYSEINNSSSIDDLSNHSMAGLRNSPQLSQLSVVNTIHYFQT